jgi:hypothetical protein
MKKITQKTYITLGLLGLMASVPLIGITSVSAAETKSVATNGIHTKLSTHKQVGSRSVTPKSKEVTGTVTLITGTNITIKSKAGVVYIVDGTNAKVMKSVIGSKPTASTVSSVLVGDTVHVQGALTGTNIVATNILDGVIPQRSATKTPHIRTSPKTTSTH